jgi:hypothetical protein
MEVKQEPLNITHEDIQSTEWADIDTFLSGIAEDNIYTSFLNEEGAETTSFSTLPDIALSNFSTEVVASLPPQELPQIQPSSVIVKKEMESKAPISKSTPQAKKQKVEKVEKKDNERYHKRLVANKKSAQASRERKKVLRTELEEKVDNLTRENANLLLSITAVETENRVLKNEFVQLQNLINDSTSMTKFAAMQQYNNPLQYDTSPVLKGIVSSPMAAALYMMVVLNSFSHYFNKQASFTDASLTPLATSTTIEVN